MMLGTRSVRIIIGAILFGAISQAVNIPTQRCKISRAIYSCFLSIGFSAKVCYAAGSGNVMVKGSVAVDPQVSVVQNDQSALYITAREGNKLSLHSKKIMLISQHFHRHCSKSSYNFLS